MRVNKLKQNKLQKLISESVRRTLAEATDFTLYGQHFHFEGPNSDKQAKAMMKKLIRQHKIENGEKVPEEPKKRKKKKTETMTDSQASPKGLAQNVKKMVTDVALKSIKGFIDHSKRQFGANATETLLNIFKKEAGGRNLFMIYNGIYNDITVTISEIENWGKKDEYAVYERARKLGKLLENMVDVLEEMGEVYTNLVQKRTISRTFGNEANVIMGNGHSLGVRSLVFAKGNIALGKLTGTLLSIANKLAMIADNGRDPLDYDVDNLRESKFRRIIAESVRKTLNEINYMDMPLGDFNERNKWFKQQADTDFPEHGIKDSPNWQDTYNSLVQKKKETDKKQKKLDKQNAKMQAFQQKMNKMRDKYNLYSKALSWAVNGTDDGFDGYNEMLDFFPIVIKMGLGKQKKVRAKIDSLTNNGFSGIMKFNGQQYYVTLNNCDIWMDDNCKVQVKLDNIKAENDNGDVINTHNFDVIATMEAMKTAFTKKVRENVKYMMQSNNL